VKVLVACEYSGIVREAFRAKGHDAWSCDLLPTEIPGQHIQAPVETLFDDEWDIVIAFPPCTHLAVSGARWFKDKREEQSEAIKFFLDLTELDCPRIAIENPVGIMSTVYRKPDQIIQPWMFGHGETKATCLWLKGLSPLMATEVVEGRREHRIHRMSPGPNRGKERSRTLPGIAQAMADQWGEVTG
jgi:site-specific DNA-cytosine methylase